MLLFKIAITALVSARAAAAIGLRAGLVDHPDARKQHQGRVPLTGGIGIFATILLGTFVFDIPPYTLATLVIALVVFLVGLFDDVRHINPWLRLGIQYTAGWLMATIGGVAIHNVGNLLAMGDIPLLLLTAPLTALAVAGLSNAYNMIDGIDGLAAALIALPLLVLFALAVQAGHPFTPTLALLWVPVLAFLLFNLGPDNRFLPKMFLGDAGSISMGFLVTASLVFFSQGDDALIRPVTALWLVTVPLMDMLATMLRRGLRRVPLMEADRLHLHHILIDEFGLGSRTTLAILVVYGSAMALLGLALEAIAPYLSLAAYFLLFSGHCGFVTRSGEIARRLRPEAQALPQE